MGLTQCPVMLNGPNTERCVLAPKHKGSCLYPQFLMESSRRGELTQSQYDALWKAAFPNCTCTYDDYGDRVVPHIECPHHGLANAIVHNYDPPPGRDVMDGGWDADYDPPPPHYATPAGMDPWAVWDAFDLDRYTANAVKYLLRAGRKDIAPRLDDLRKARNYINKAIEVEESKA